MTLRKYAFLVWFACLVGHAQDTEFLSEVDGHLTLDSSFKAYLQAKDDREGGDPEQFTFGPSIQIYRKPLIKLKKVTVFDLDNAKSRPLVIESGYRIITASDTAVEHRAVEAMTGHFPFVAGILLTERNRADLDWQNGRFTWRYRNKLTLERTVSIRSYHFIPYVAAEPFYESQYSKWSATDLYAGCLFPIGKHVELDSNYQHENDTGKRPNRQNHYIGLTLNLYFSLASKSQSPPAPKNVK